jgi:hypothetical protein
MVEVLAEAGTAGLEDGEAAETEEFSANGAEETGAEVAVGRFKDDKECLLFILVLSGSSITKALFMLIPLGK